MRDRFEKPMTVALVVTAVAVAGSAGSRVFQGPPAGASLEAREPEFVKGWEDALPFATRVAGSEAAPVTILALVDLECGPCRAFHELAVDLASERSGDIQLLYVHHPLAYHPSALPAARAAECAMDYGPDAFARWVDAVYAQQDSLGRRPWTRYAADAGLPNPTLIEECTSDARREDRIKAGLRFGEEIGLEGTPTVIVNGWRYYETPTREELQAVIDSLMVGRSRN